MKIPNGTDLGAAYGVQPGWLIYVSEVLSEFVIGLPPDYQPLDVMLTPAQQAELREDRAILVDLLCPEWIEEPNRVPMHVHPLAVALTKRRHEGD